MTETTDLPALLRERCALAHLGPCRDGGSECRNDPCLMCAAAGEIERLYAAIIEEDD